MLMLLIPAHARDTNAGDVCTELRSALADASLIGRYASCGRPTGIGTLEGKYEDLWP
jgi:hypothetical protein